MEMIIWYFIGVLIGVLGQRHFSKKEPVGFLRVDRSDPDGPLLFLELKQPIKDISRKKTVTFLVKCENFIRPHE